MTKEEVEEIVNQLLNLKLKNESTVNTGMNNENLQPEKKETQSNNDFNNINAFLDKELGLDEVDKPTLPIAVTSNEPVISNIDDEIESLQNKLKELMALKSQKEQNQSGKVDVKTDNGNTNVVVNMPQNNDTLKHFNLVCETCGSTDIHMVDNSLGVCEHCGAKVVVKKSTNTPLVKVNVFNDKDESVSPYYVMKTNYDETEFKRSFFINISAISKTPPDILQSKFGEVKTVYPQFMVCTIQVDGSYSASVGYDRKEQYETFENKYDYDLKMTIRQRVIKERTVTDWQPYNGNVSTNKIVSVGIKEALTNDDSKYFDNLIAKIDFEANTIPFEDSELDMEFVKPSSSVTETAISSAKQYAQKQINFPGDHVKDVRTNFSCRILDTKFCIAPTYVMSYQYDGEEYEMRSFTTSYDGVGDSPSIENSVCSFANQQSRKYGVMSILLSLLSMGLAIVFPLLLKGVIGVFLGILSMVPSIIGYRTYKKLRGEKEKRIYQSVLDEKRQQVESYLTQHNMAPLTEEEKELFTFKQGWMYD